MSTEGPTSTSTTTAAAETTRPATPPPPSGEDRADDGAAVADELGEWRAQGRREASANMKAWQQGWTDYCGDRCCYSPACATIRCDCCMSVLTRGAPPPDRYVCMECALGDEPTLCPTCFVGAEFPHNHTKWCLVTAETGDHTITTRTNSSVSLPATRKNLTDSGSWLDEFLGAFSALHDCFETTYNSGTTTPTTAPIAGGGPTTSTTSAGVAGSEKDDKQQSSAKQDSKDQQKDQKSTQDDKSGSPDTAATPPTTSSSSASTSTTERTISRAQLRALLTSLQAHVQLPPIPPGDDSALLLPQVTNYTERDCANVLRLLLLDLHPQQWIQRLIAAAYDSF